MPLRFCHAGDFHLDEDHYFAGAPPLNNYRDGKPTDVVPELRMSDF